MTQEEGNVNNSQINERSCLPSSKPTHPDKATGLPNLKSILRNFCQIYRARVSGDGLEGYGAFKVPGSTSLLCINVAIL